jgi:hypothetical protein
VSQDSPLPEEGRDTVPEQRKIRRVGRRRLAGLSPQRRRSLRGTRKRKAVQARRWAKYRRPTTEVVSTVDDISVVVYLDTDNPGAIADVLARVDILRTVAGYGGPERYVSIEYGSIFRRSWAVVRRGLSTGEVKDRLAKVERAVELMALDQHQAAYDQVEANAVNGLIASTKDIPRVCVRIGSILLLKFVSPQGEPVVIVRNLTQLEIQAFERYPEIQRKPELTLEGLATVMDTTAEVKANTTAPPGGLATTE